VSSAASSSRENGPTIDETAAEWLARREAGWSAAEAAAFERWRRADSRHDRAVSRLETTQQLLSRLPESPAAAELWREVEELTRSAPRVVRFPLWARGLAAAAALTVLIAAGWQIASRTTEFARSYLTDAVAAQELDLPDGSHVRLAQASALAVRYSRGERLLDLPRGEAYFEVVRDPQRPFLVTAGGISVRAVGTAFSVRHHASTAIEVMVTEGQVRVERTPGAPAAARAVEPVLLSAGERLWWDPQRGRGAPALARVVAEPESGRSGGTTSLLKFLETTLGQVVAEFNRHNRVQIEIADAALAQRVIEGTFDPTAAETFATLVAENGDIRIERPSPDRIILRQAR
jgi:transmembrane sensor